MNKRISYASDRARASLSPTINAVSSLHGAPDGMPELRVSLAHDLPPQTQGILDLLKPGIRINQQSPLRGLTLAHEIGHALDRWGFGDGSTWGTASLDGPLGRVIRAFLATPSAAQLLRLRHVDDRAVYLLQPEEIWARMYAQFVAAASGDARLERELLRFGGKPGPRDLTYTLTKAEFTDVGAAIVAALGDAGWLVKES